MTCTGPRAPGPLASRLRFPDAAHGVKQPRSHTENVTPHAAAQSMHDWNEVRGQACSQLVRAVVHAWSHARSKPPSLGTTHAAMSSAGAPEPASAQATVEAHAVSCPDADALHAAGQYWR